MKKNRALCALMTLCVFCGLLFTGCNKETPESPIALAIVVSRHANQNEFSDEVYERVKPWLNRAVYDGKVSVILADGKPYKETITDANGNPFAFSRDANNTTIRGRRIAAYTSALLDFIKSDALRARTEEVNLLESIKIAADCLDDNIGAPGTMMEGEELERHVIVLGTGVSTEGRVNFRNIKIDDFEKDIEFLKENAGILPNLAGVTVHWFGFGDVAEPQVLPDVTLPKLKNFWSELLKRCGVGVEDSLDINSALRGNKPNKYTEDEGGFPFVSIVEFKTVEPDWSKEGLQLPDVGFVKNEDTFLKPENAKQQLENTAQTIQNYLEKNPESKLYMVGTTATTTPNGPGDLSLSQRRAARLLAMLVDHLDVEKGRLVSFGVGANVPKDLRIYEFPKGKFDTALAQANRKATVYTVENKDFQRILDHNGLIIDNGGNVVPRQGEK